MNFCWSAVASLLLPPLRKNHAAHHAAGWGHASKVLAAILAALVIILRILADPASLASGAR